MSTTTNPPVPQPQSILVTFAEIGLSVLSQVTTGSLSTDVAIAAALAPLIQTAIMQVVKPTLSGITGLLDKAAQILESTSTGAVANDAAVADALLKMVQAAAQAVQAQAGLPIDPSLVPQLPSFTPTA